MFGRNSNPVKAMKDVQRIKINGGTADLSFSQVVCLICNSQDAQRNLSQEEFAYYKVAFDMLRKETKCSTVDMNGYLQMCEIIINTFEKKIPYMLFDGEHSENLEMRNQIKIRKLHSDGYKFVDALSKYENEYSSIPQYTDYDPIENPILKRFAKEQEYFVSGFVRKFLDNQASLEKYGYLMGMADAIYFSIANKYGKADATEESIITFYTMTSLAIVDYSDYDIDVIMKKRQVISANNYKELCGIPNSQVCEKVAKAVSSEYSISQNEYQNVFKYIEEYYNIIQNIFAEILTK